MSSLATLLTRRPWRVIAIAVAFLAVAVVVGGPLTGNLTSAGFEDPSAEFVAARDTLRQAAGANPNPGVIALVQPGSDVRTGAGRAAVEKAAATIAADPDIATVVTAFNGGGTALISKDGTQSYMAAYMKPVSDDQAGDAAKRIRESLDAQPVKVGGADAVGDEVGTIIGEDLAKAEMLAFPIIFLLSLWVFRGFVAALLPSLMGGVVIFGSFLAIGLANEAMTLSIYALNLAIGLSLGLAIDYSLLIISRYREEMARRGGPGRDALAATLRTAGKSVLFSAVTVAAALAGLMVFPQRFLFSMGLAGVMVALIAAAIALLVLPAVLALLGTKINAGAPKSWRRRSEHADEELTSGFWYRLSNGVMRRPGIVAATTAVVLVIVALPAFGINFTSVDASVLPTSASARQVADTIAADFPQDRSQPTYIAVSAPNTRQAEAALADYAQRLSTLPNVAGVTPPAVAGDGVWRIDVYGAVNGLTQPAQDLVRDIRAVPSPYPSDVGGLAASFVDQKASIAAHLPWAILLIAAVTIIALFIMTGSVILPVKAVIMNLLTLGATLGILVWVFQDGRLEGLLNYDSVGALDLTQPILLGAMAFGLSTDYAVFLLSRIKEGHDHGLGTREAVAVGLQRTGRIVTAAALLFAVAIGAFATSRITLIKELGVGTALAVLIDATIIRAMLVPSLMALFGDWNWWAPRPLRRLHRRIGFSESDADEPEPEASPAGA